MPTTENSDYKELLCEFNAEGVEYLIVGAHALALHGYQRYTKDFDLWVRPDRENAKRVYRALARFGVALDRVTIDDFVSDDLIFQIGVEPIRIDVITSIEGVAWEDAWPKRVRAKFGEVPTAYLGLDELVQNKRSTGRPRDSIDIDELLRIRNAPSLE